MTSEYVACECGADCYIRSVDQEDISGPCWGTVTAIDEIGSEEEGPIYVHACEGHYSTYEDGEYLEDGA